MSNELATTNEIRDQAAIMERVLMVGDLEQLTSEERITYYMALCHSLKLNPLSRPFAFVTFDKQLQLYARKDCAEQLRRIHGVSIIDLKAQQTGDLYVVTATARAADGRTDVDQGVVDTSNLRGQMLANGWMRAATKAKRRVTLSLCGLGIVDESELDTISGARMVEVDMATGEILEPPAALPARGATTSNSSVQQPAVDKPTPGQAERWKAVKARANALSLDLEHCRPKAGMDREGVEALLVLAESIVSTEEQAAAEARAEVAA